MEEKIKSWFQNIYIQMRMQGEQGLDQLAIFSVPTYIEWQKNEPDIDKILDIVLPNLADVYDEPNFVTEVNQRLGRYAS